MAIFIAFRVVVIVFVSYLIYRFASYPIDKVIRRVIRPDAHSSPDSEKRREDTLIQFFTKTTRVLVFMVAIGAILSVVGVEVGPLLAAAGVVGVAVGFGSQYLIRDIFTGILLVFENQYRVGDSICIDSTCGIVEEVTLRITRLRDLDGNVHFIPHGEVKRVTNRSRGFSRININIGVSYETDMARVAEVIESVGKELALDPEWKDAVHVPPKMLRVEEFGDSAIVIKITGDTAPGRNIDAAGELRRRLKLAFDREGITIPFPQRVVHTHKKARAKDA